MRINNQGFLLLLILFALSSCSAPREVILLDLIQELTQAETTPLLHTIKPFEYSDQELELMGWERDEKAQSDAVLIPVPKRRAFWKFGLADREKKRIVLTVTCLSRNSKSRPLLGISVNGKTLRTVPLYRKGFERIAVEASSEHLSIGQNYLGLHLASGQFQGSGKYWLALRQVEIADSETLPAPPALPASSSPRIITRRFLFLKKRAVDQGFNTSLEYFFKVPGEARFRSSFSVVSSRRDPLSGMVFLVYLETASGEKRVLFEKPLDKGLGKKRMPLEIDLSPYESQMVKLSFICFDGGKIRSSPAHLLIWEPRIIAESEDAILEEINSQSPDLDKPFNLLIYLCDCLRPDYLPFFGYPKNLALQMDLFARESIIFRNAYAQGSWTRPSVGALFTGLHPFIHQALNLKSGLAEELVTLAEVLRDKGYYTAGISSNVGVKERFNFHQGFTFFKYHSYLGGGLSEKLNEYVFSELAKKKIPFFLYIHVMDSHRPYQVKEEFLSSPEEQSSAGDHIIVKVKTGRRGERDVDLTALVSTYEATIRQTDHSFGRLLVELKRLGLYDNTLIILMSDHGTEFYEHGKFAHGKTLFQEVIRQLLVVKLPGQRGAGREVLENVQEIDLFPTILDLAGESLPDYLLGRSLKGPLLTPENTRFDWGREIIVENATEQSRFMALIDGDWKLIARAPGWRDGFDMLRLFNLKSDPEEKTNLIWSNQVASRYLLQRLTIWVENKEKLARMPRQALDKTLTKEEIEELRALGYIR